MDEVLFSVSAPGVDVERLVMAALAAVPELANAEIVVWELDGGVEIDERYY